jgi:hypothetical protein
MRKFVSLSPLGLPQFIVGGMQKITKLQVQTCGLRHRCRARFVSQALCQQWQMCMFKIVASWLWHIAHAFHKGTKFCSKSVCTLVEVWLKKCLFKGCTGLKETFQSWEYGLRGGCSERFHWCYLPLPGYRDLEAFLTQKRASWTPNGPDWSNLKTLVTFGCQANKPFTQFETLCHADVWNGNLMFSSAICSTAEASSNSQDTRHLTDCLVLDWQLYSAASPAVDVCNVLQFCTHFKGESENERVLRIYWEELTKILQLYQVSMIISVYMIMKHIRTASLSALETSMYMLLLFFYLYNSQRKISYCMYP